MRQSGNMAIKDVSGVDTLVYTSITEKVPCVTKRYASYTWNILEDEKGFFLHYKVAPKQCIPHRRISKIKGEKKSSPCLNMGRRGIEGR